jgi:hypothetical protein
MSRARARTCTCLWYHVGLLHHIIDPKDPLLTNASHLLYTSPLFISELCLYTHPLTRVPKKNAWWIMGFIVTNIIKASSHYQSIFIYLNF